MGLTDAVRGLRSLFFRDARAEAELLCLHLLPRQQLRLRDSAGWVVECCRGTVWITQERDARDVMLRPGERFTLDRDGTTLVSGLSGGEAVMAVRPPRAARAPWRWNDPASYRRAGLL
jgi:hypothetical protein